jgi:hypothetical protein
MTEEAVSCWTVILGLYSVLQDVKAKMKVALRAAAAEAAQQQQNNRWESHAI